MSAPRPFTERTAISEAELEGMADRIIQRRLTIDTAYKHAENAQDQAEREAAIEQEVMGDLLGRYRIA